MKTSFVIFTFHSKVEVLSISKTGIFDASVDAAVIFLDAFDDHRISVNLQATSESPVCQVTTCYNKFTFAITPICEPVGCSSIFARERNRRVGESRSVYKFIA